LDLIRTDKTITTVYKEGNPVFKSAILRTVMECEEFQF